ncbi:11129_t:CDS:2 [Gigaspora margarita]|uniref:11129_t:CDS:1 n=1 Tax=Gigaspora margarita TaxID=4874 RepID=A0ABN7UYT1_GIGMA|nr:11129_t:CDS:2 [Gigaspora margarita]
MIKSLLNKPFRRVTIDKYISKNGLNNEIILDPKEVKLKVNSHFQNQFRKRSVKLAAMPSNWKTVYKPKKEIKDVLLLEISNDKRKKEWVLSEEGEAFKIKEKKKKTIQVAKLETRIEKCSECEHNRSIVEKSCTTHIRFDVGWKVIPKNTISRIESSTQMQANFNLALLARETYNKDPLENEQEFKNLYSLESPEKELILQAELKEELKEEILAILTRSLNHQKRNGSSTSR